MKTRRLYRRSLISRAQAIKATVVYLALAGFSPPLWAHVGNHGFLELGDSRLSVVFHYLSSPVHITGSVFFLVCLLALFFIAYKRKARSVRIPGNDRF